MTMELFGRNIEGAIPGTPSFKYNEFFRSATAKRRRINNLPDKPEILENIELLAVNVLQPVRDAFGPIRITSGYRCRELCRVIGSSSLSNHVKGQAADIEPYDNNIKLLDIAKFIYAKLEFRELIAEYFPDGWIHVAYRHNDNTGVLKVKDEHHNYSRFSMGLLERIYGE